MSFGKAMHQLGKPLLRKLVHKDYKIEILTQLKDQYGISEQALFINTPFVEAEGMKIKVDCDAGLRHVSTLLKFNPDGEGELKGQSGAVDLGVSL